MEQFSYNEEYDRLGAINELKQIYNCSGTFLGDNSIDTDTALLFDDFDKEKLLFSPLLDVTKIFEEQPSEEMVLSSDIRLKQENNDFYFIKIPIILFPKPDWAFTKIECMLQFTTTKKEEKCKPIVYEMFPSDLWQELLSLTTDFEVNLNGDLRFCTCLPESYIGSLSETFKSNLCVHPKLKFKLKHSNNVNLRRSQIFSRGRLNSICFWRLESKQYIADEDIIFQVVLMVPKQLNDKINVVCKMRAYHSFQFVNSKINNMLVAMRENLRNIFNQGLPLSGEMEWEDILN